MGHVAEHVKIHYQFVVGALKQRVIHPPAGERYLTNKAALYRGIIVMAEDRQQCIGVITVAVPNMIERCPFRIGLAIGFISIFVVAVTFTFIAAPVVLNVQQGTVLAR